MNALQKNDFVFVHVEAPDEAGHNGDRIQKIQAIENFDEKVVGTIIKGIKTYSAYRILILPDHATPLTLRTHVADPVPFALMGTDIKPDNTNAFNEQEAAHGLYKMVTGHELIELLMRS